MQLQLWSRSVLALAILPVLGGFPLAAQEKDTMTRICLAPAAIEASSGSATAAIDAARETLKAYLTGPSLSAEPLTSRLASQAREEAKKAGCPYLLLPTIKHEQKRGGSSLLGRVAAGAVQQGAYEAGVASGTAAGRIAGQATYSAAGQAAYNYAVTVHNKDELTLGYRLETSDGGVLLDKREKRKAKQDGEDLLSPLVQSAAERIVAAVKGGKQ